MFEDYLREDLVLPASQLPASIREADANAESLLYEEGRQFVDGLPLYWSYLTTRIGDIERPTVEDFLNLQEPDRIFLAIRIHMKTFGPKIILTGDCPQCSKPANYPVDLSKLDIVPIPDGATPPTPLFRVTLPRTKHKIVHGYRTGHEENEEAMTPGFDPTRMSYKAIRSIDGKTEVKLTEIRSWPLLDHKVLRESIAKSMCGYDTRVRFIHTACRKSVVMNILSDPSFLMGAVSLSV